VLSGSAQGRRRQRSDDERRAAGGAGGRRHRTDWRWLTRWRSVSKVRNGKIWHPAGVRVSLKMDSKNILCPKII
jgi:hypothetical protein